MFFICNLFYQYIPEDRRPGQSCERRDPLMSSRLCVLLSLAVAIFLSVSLKISFTDTQDMSLLALEYEVFGKVQGVFFRKFTNEKAQRKGISGKLKIFTFEV